MSVKRKFAVFSILIGGAIVLVVLAAALIYRSVIAPYFDTRDVPPELRQARVVTGADFLISGEKTVWRYTARRS